MSEEKLYFEVVDSGGGKHLYDTSKYSWSWGVLQGTIDTDDLKLVCVYDLDDEESVEPYRSFPFARSVGRLKEQ